MDTHVRHHLSRQKPGDLSYKTTVTDYRTQKAVRRTSIHTHGSHYLSPPVRGPEGPPHDPVILPTVNFPVRTGVRG